MELRGCDRPLVEEHDLFMLDLDGVVYIDGHAVAGVPEHVERIRAAGAAVAFVTNNASRTAADVAERLVGMGVAAGTEDVVTSAQAAAGLLGSRFGTGARVLVLGGAGLHGALEDAGLVPVADPDDDDVAAVVSGYGPDVLWRHVMRCAVRIRAGLPWVASNDDMSIPTSYGPAPGHGVLVRTLADFSGVTPVVAGKPSPPLLEETIARVGGAAPLMVGDRLDTDIEGANNLGLPSLLVLTGVTGLEELVGAAPAGRPTYVAPTLAGAFEPHPVPAVEGGRHSLGGWAAVATDGRLVVEGRGSEADWWRVVASAAWQHLDRTGTAVALDRIEPPQPSSGPGSASGSLDP